MFNYIWTPIRATNKEMNVPIKKIVFTPICEKIEYKM